jgi:hypothetical protein
MNRPATNRLATNWLDRAIGAVAPGAGLRLPRQLELARVAG